MTATAEMNRLAEETSPYLRQHAENPVHWQPWDRIALERAKRENKPILLSVGYAACHWCHVMAHESFEDPGIAALMNDHFVSIKVDREERPDLDIIYQQALALLGEHGGWPLTMFLTPEGKPFWGGTYFPPEPRFGRPAFRDVLARIAEIYAQEPDKIRQNVAALSDALESLAAANTGSDIPVTVTEQVAARLLGEVDRVNGGIGTAPKFPQPSIMELLWRTWKRTGDLRYRDAVLLTLDRMCQGGIYDHLGGGFARYATDAGWLVPHFEKMLYDNAQMLELLAHAWQDTGGPLYAQRVRETVNWMLRELRLEDGGFAGSLDADSEGEEGRYYVWTESEIDSLLGNDAAAFKAAYDVTPGGNWEGRTILHRNCRPLLGTGEDELRLARCREVLFAAREKRVRPGLDDKVLADWNGLAISALAHVACVFDLPEALSSARDAYAFVARRMVDNDGGAERLKHCWCRGRLSHAATLDDYANMCRAALALYEATGESSYLDQARSWVEVVDRHYRDGASGSYFFSADDVDDVITRTRTVADNATPAGNAVLAGIFARLYFLTGDDHYRERAAGIVTAFSGEIHRNVFPLSTLLNANEFLRHAVQVVVVGARGEPETDALLAAVHAVSAPDLVLQVVGDGAALPERHPAHGKGRVDGHPTVYICRGTTCSLPLTAPEPVREALASR